jgi:glyoxylase-like metal-dependent hydrolase (beta-lactamase superfamily II)
MEVRPLTDRVWCLHTPIVQAYAVRQGHGFNLIDTSTAGSEDAILEALAGIAGVSAGEVTIRDIVLTHGHDDHAGSAAALVEQTGARVLASAVEAPFIQGEEELPPPQLLDWEVALLEQVAPNVPKAPPVRVDVELGDGMTLGWDRPASVLAAPGHTPGSIALLFEQDKLLIAGDAIASHEGQPMLGVFNSDPPVAAQSFRRLAELDVEIACFGHGDALRADARSKLASVATQMG